MWEQLGVVRIRNSSIPAYHYLQRRVDVETFAFDTG